MPDPGRSPPPSLLSPRPTHLVSPPRQPQSVESDPLSKGDCSAEDYEMDNMGGKRDVVKRAWTAEEDAQLLRLVEEHGPRRWSVIAAQLYGRVGKQCRERWHNHLCPSVNKEEWTEEEDRMIMELVQQMGTKWSKIVKLLPGRTDNAIKNRWNSTMRKTLRRQLKEVGAMTAPIPELENLPARKRGAATSAEVATAAAAAAVTAAAAATATRPAVGTSRSPAGKRKRGGGSGGGGAAAAAAAAAAAGALAAAASAAELAAPGPPAVLAPAEGLDQQAAKRGLPIGSRARAPAPARARKQQEARARQQTLMQQRLSELGGEEDYSNGSPLPSRGAAPAPVASATHDGVHPWSPTSPEDAPPQLALGLNTLVLDPKLMNTTADSSDAAQPAPASVSPLDGGVLHGEPVSVSPLGPEPSPLEGGASAENDWMSAYHGGGVQDVLRQALSPGSALSPTAASQMFC